MDVLEILPPLIIGEEETDRSYTLNDCQNSPGPIRELGIEFHQAILPEIDE